MPEVEVRGEAAAGAAHAAPVVRDSSETGLGEAEAGAVGEAEIGVAAAVVKLQSGRRRRRCCGHAARKRWRTCLMRRASTSAS